MRIQRYQPHRTNRLPWILAGCFGLTIFTAIACVAGIFIVVNFAPNVILQAAGFQPAGDTDIVFSEQAAGLPPSLVIQATIAPAEIMVDAGQFGQHSLGELESSGVQVALGSTGPEAMQPDAVITTIDETGLLDLCRRFSTICDASNPAIRGVAFDLRPGGVVINGEVLLPQTGTWQRAGIVMRLAGSNTLEVVGVDVNGSLFSVPPGELASLVAQAANAANDLVNRFAIETGGTRYALSELYIDDATLTAILR